MSRQQPITDAATIAGTVEEIRGKRFPGWSRDYLLCHPEESINLCAVVRKKLSRPRLTNFEILWAFLNASKRSRLPAKRQRELAGAR